MTCRYRTEATLYFVQPLLRTGAGINGIGVRKVRSRTGAGTNGIAVRKVAAKVAGSGGPACLPGGGQRTRHSPAKARGSPAGGFFRPEVATDAKTRHRPGLALRLDQGNAEARTG